MRTPAVYFILILNLLSCFLSCFTYYTFILSPTVEAQEVTRPYKKMLDTPLAFNGIPGKIVDPSSLNSIPIGLFAPVSQDDPVALELYHGSLLALEEANDGGGFKGVPFRLVRRWAGDPWGAGSKEVIHFVYQDEVWALIASGNGAAHIAEQIAAKAYVPVLAPVSSASSLTHGGVPWIFRLPPDGKKQARLLINDCIIKKGFQRVGLVSATHHDGRTAAREMEKELKRRNIPPLFHFNVPPDLPELRTIVERIRTFRPGVLILCLPAPVIPRLLKTLQDKRICCTVCLPWTPGVEAEYLDAIFHGTLFIVEPFQPALREGFSRFSSEYKKRFGVLPGCIAAYAYDAARMIICSVKSNGLNRPAIRRGLAELSGFEGISGSVTWDNGGGSNAVPVIYASGGSPRGRF